MKITLSILLTLILSTTLAFPQDLTLFIPGDVGTELHYEIRNAKEKLHNLARTIELRN